MSLRRPVSCLIVVLGAPNDELGNLSSIARERLELAVEEYFQRPDSGILLTGGFGPHFNRSALPHAQHARSFLLRRGVPDGAFAEFALSSNTIEDASIALPIVERYSAERLIVVTSEFHIERARYIFDRVFAHHTVTCVGAPHDGAPAVLRELAEHEASALARLRAVRGSSRDALSAGARRPTKPRS